MGIGILIVATQYLVTLTVLSVYHEVKPFYTLWPEMLVAVILGWCRPF